MTNRRVVKGVIWSAIERFSVQGIQFIIGIVLARLLSVSDFGLVGMLAIFIAIAQSITDSGFSNALIRKINRTQTDYSTAFLFNIAVGAILYTTLYLCAPLIAHFYNQPILVDLVKIIGLTLFFNSLTVVQRAIFTIKIDFKSQTKASLTAVTISGVVGIYLAYTGFGVWSLAVQTTLNSLLNCVLMWALSKWRPTLQFSKQSFNELFGYGSKLLLSGLIDVIYKNLFTLIIGKKFSSTDLGYYTRADQFAQLPSSNITGILQRVTFPVLSEIQDQDEKLRETYTIYLRISAYVIFPLMVALSALAEPLINIVLTPKWAGVVPLLMVVSLSYMWYPVHSINLNLLQVKGRTDLFLRLEIIKKAIGVAVLCITIPYGVFAMCVGGLITSLTALIINIHYTKKLINLGLFTQMRDILPTLCYSLIAGITAFSFRYSGLDDISWLILGGIAMFFVYLLLSLVFKAPELKMLKAIIKR